MAERAEVSKGTLYRYFDSKEILFRETVRANIVTLLVAGEELIRTHHGTSRELLTLLIRRMWDSMRDPRRAGIGRLVQSELHEFPELARFYFEEVILRGRRMIQAVLDRGVASGEFRPDLHGFTASSLPHLLMVSAQTQCFFTTMDPERLGDDEVVAGILELFLNGVEARPPAGPTG